MHTLIVCDRCGHGAYQHDGSGCEVLACRCAHMRDGIIDDALRAARVEGMTAWKAVDAHQLR